MRVNLFRPIFLYMHVTKFNLDEVLYGSPREFDKGESVFRVGAKFHILETTTNEDAESKKQIIDKFQCSGIIFQLMLFLTVSQPLSCLKLISKCSKGCPNPGCKLYPLAPPDAHESITDY